ncbi:hypothetical protein EPN52_11280 [bacterium]|nr:MAG: hypothetical protein EPN52_11280 [bacterium]
MEYVEPTPEERQRAAGAYAFWVLALPELAPAARPASAWFRAHIRQAVALGLVETAALLIVLALPAVLVGVALALRLPVGTAATVWIYALGFVLDVAAIVLGLALNVALAARAARGERFTIAFLPRSWAR